MDAETIEDFEKDLKDNLYKLWNRMTSGSYFPPSVRLVEIPKKDGGKRVLGIPTVTDRIAQMVAKLELEPRVEPQFQPDSYGYRPKKSALEAVRKARERCWKYDWVIDLDIKGFFDSIDHELMMGLVRKHSEEKWVALYIERWLKATGEKEGKVIARREGTPQGGVISPLLANIFLHHAFDAWMGEVFLTVPFERYADDVIVHCKTEKQAKYVLGKIIERLREWKLTVHPEKTVIVYCKDTNRKEEYPNIQFDFLGYTFRPRGARGREGRLFTGFLPAVSRKAGKRIRETIRGWKLTKETTASIWEIAKRINPIVRGWLNYYGAIYASAMRPILRDLEFAIVRWAMRKYKHLHRKWMQTYRWLQYLSKRERNLFAHWVWKLEKAEQ